MAKPERRLFSHSSQHDISEREERYRSLFEYAPISLWEEDLSEVKKYFDDLRGRGVEDLRSYGRAHPEETAPTISLIKIVDVNKATLKLYGAKSRQEFINALPGCLTPESYETFQEALISFVEGRIDFSAETVNKTLAGKRINVSFGISLAPGHEETWGRALVSVIDITELKLAQRQFETILSTAIDGFWITDAEEGRFLDVNDAYCRLIGYSREELLTMRIQDVEAAETQAETARHIRRVVEMGGDRFETRHRRKDGKVLDIEVSVNYLDFWGGRFFVFLRDVTERKKAQEMSDAFNEINLTITSTRDVNQTLQKVVRTAWKAIGSETASVILREGGAWVPAYLEGFPPDLAGKRYSDQEVPHLAVTAETKNALIVNDAFVDERVNQALMEQMGIRSFMAVPLMVRGEVFGILAFHYRSGPIAFTQDQIDFAGKLAILMSLALESAETHQGMRQALADAHTLGEVAARISQTLELETVLDTTLDETLKALSVAHGCIYVFDDSGQLVIRTHRGLSPEFIKFKSILGPGEGCAGEAAVSKEVFAPTKEMQHFACAESKKLLGLDCLAAVPIVSRDESLGVLEVFAPVARRLSTRELRMARTISNQLAAALQNARLFSAERNIAKTLQEALLTIPDKVSGADFDHLYRSATAEAAQVGGDFYDLFELDDNKIGLIVGDVSGKGLAAATLTARVKSTIKAYAFEHDSPAAVIAKTNQIICKTLSQFTTVFFGVLDKTSGELVYCSAGHPTPIVKRKSGRSEWLQTRSPAVGVLPELGFSNDKSVLQAGDLLFLYTDGVTEARERDELFGEERLIGLIETLAPETPSRAAQAVFEAVTQFAHGSLADDIAILAVTLTR